MPRDCRRRRIKPPVDPTLHELPAQSTSRPLRVLYPGSLELGGAERQMLLLAANLPKDEFRVDFVTIGGWTSNVDEAAAVGARVHMLSLPRRGTTSVPLQAARFAARIPQFVAICRREQYDIADAWLFLGAGLVALTRPLTRIPVLVCGRRSLSGYENNFGLPGRVLDAIARRSADAIVANSEAVARDVALHERVEPSRLRIIRNGVDVPDPISVEDRAAIRCGWGIGREDLLIGLVGTLKQGKGQERVLRILGSDMTGLRDARVVVVGDGPSRPELTSLVRSLGLEGRVTFTGRVPDARPYYPAFDIVVSASEAEGLPNVVIEAAAAGCAIVATDAGGTREVVEDGVTGLLVPVGDDRALAGALLRLSSEPRLLGRLGGAARQHAIAAFGLERFVRETASLYRELASRRRRLS